ncbi:titin-like isoform X2 [Armigeres subalbatus]|uniref:titin-like isoform X2 n=1 Tax=Armigeres subalbatus TaxID=124917 RepID=UPI002ED0E453
MNRGADAKTPLKDGANAGELSRATKSGRKVKRPAHFDDSPDAKKLASELTMENVTPKKKEIPEVVKKSARKTLLKTQSEDSPLKTNGEMTVDVVVKKSARKTLVKQAAQDEEAEPTHRSSRKTIAAISKEDSPEPEVFKKSARKTMLKSGVKKCSEQTLDTVKNEKPEVETLTKSGYVKKVEEEENDAPGVSRTGRKIKIPAHLKEFDDVVVPSPKKEALEKASVRKSLAPVAVKKEEGIPKTPGRARSLAPSQKAPEPEPKEIKNEPKTPRRGKSLAARKLDDDPLALPSSPEETKKDKRLAKSPKNNKNAAVDPLELKADEIPVKTPKRGKSLAAPEVTKTPVQDKAPAKTPSKRGKSMIALSPERSSRTPKQAVSSKLIEDSTNSEPMSRSGRKIKPKKYFGEFEEEEPVAPPPSLPSKVASPVKVVAKSSPAPKKEPPAKVASPIKAIVKSSPVTKKELPTRVSSPAKVLHRSPTVTKKESPPKRIASPVKRHLATKVESPSPNKKAKLEQKLTVIKSDNSKKLDEISPNTEERQITKRGVNDHHHATKDSSLPGADGAEETAEVGSSDAKKKNPTTEAPVDEQTAVEENKPKRGRKTITAEPAKPKETAAVEEPKPAVQQQADKPKRGRKTLPAPTAESSDEAEEPAPAKAPKTPTARRMTTALVPAAAATEDVGSSRSGRKIKPKKFFGEDEPASTSKPPKTATANGAPAGTGGRGRRKTLAAELDKADSAELKDDKVDEVVAVAPKAEVEECPSREEIMTVVGIVDPVVPVEKPKEEEKMEVDEAQPTNQKEEGHEEEHAEEPVPVEEENLPQESKTESITTPVVGAEPEQEEEAPSVVEADPIADDAPVQLAETVQEDQIQSVEPEDGDDDEADHVEQKVENDSCTALEPETVKSSEEDFQETSIPQTSPRPSQTMEEVPKSPAQLLEEPPVVEQTDLEAMPDDIAEEIEKIPESPEETEDFAQIIEQGGNDKTFDIPVEMSEEEHGTEILQTCNEEEAVPSSATEIVQQTAEVSASSSFSEALLVDDEAAEQRCNDVAEITGSQYESVEFLEMSGASTAANEPEMQEPEPVQTACTNGHEQEEQVPNRIVTPDLEDDLDNTEAPCMDDIDDEKEDELLEDVPEPKDATFSERDRDNESIIVIPDTPKPPKSELDEEFDLTDKSFDPQTSQTTVARLDLHHSPVVKKEMVPATPKTPDTKPIKTSCSPDKPDVQEQANVPNEVIEITDSPIALIDPKLRQTEDSGSLTSTPLKMGSKMTTTEKLIQNSRKRSLSASDAEIVKKNVTFHSPANSTMLVDTIDERLKKKNESATKMPQGHRKRSLSEHKDAHLDGPKPSKISKLPNFKSIHQQQFNRMESIEEFHNRKVQRAKDILATSTVKSPAATALVRSAERPPMQKSISLQHKSPYKTGNGSSSSYHHASSKPHVVRPLIPKTSESHHHKLPSDAERQEKRQKQFQTVFKTKSLDSGSGSAGASGKDTPDGARRVIEQSRHKQNQILKGVRTNKRFELLMKYRDAQE